MPPRTNRTLRENATSRVATAADQVIRKMGKWLLLEFSRKDNLPTLRFLVGPDDTAQATISRRKDGTLSYRLREGWEKLPVDYHRIEYLFDLSEGAGMESFELWPKPPPGQRVGYAGGIGPHNIRRAMEFVNQHTHARIWLDMERNVRTPDYLMDLGKVREVCQMALGGKKKLRPAARSPRPQPADLMQRFPAGRGPGGNRTEMIRDFTRLQTGNPVGPARPRQPGGHPGRDRAPHPRARLDPGRALRERVTLLVEPGRRPELLALPSALPKKTLELSVNLERDVTITVWGAAAAPHRGEFLLHRPETPDGKSSPGRNLHAYGPGAAAVTDYMQDFLTEKWRLGLGAPQGLPPGALEAGRGPGGDRAERPSPTGPGNWPGGPGPRCSSGRTAPRGRTHRGN